jgi:hypothetical protein
MHLLIRRMQRDDGWVQSSITFILYAQLDLTEEEQFQFEKYDLYSRIVYNSEDFLTNLEAADKHRGKAAATEELGEIISNSFSALYYNIAGRLTLQLSVQNIVDGIRIESQELDEILRIEGFIRNSAEALASYIDVALTFDGQEQLDEY